MSDSESSVREFDDSNVTSDREIEDSRRSDDEADDKAVTSNVEPEEPDEGDEGFPAEDDKSDEEDESEGVVGVGDHSYDIRVSKDVDMADPCSQPIVESSDDSDYEPPCETEESIDDRGESDDADDIDSDFGRTDDEDSNSDRDYGVTSDSFWSDDPSESDQYGKSSDCDDSRNNSGID